MFHSWKRSFKAMVRDADIAPEQELNYLRSFTSGDPQQLVDNYRKRPGDSPATTVADLWAELERRFGNAATLTQDLIERLCTAASFGERENAKLQKLADLCADVDCQMTHLPGLACLNYPIAIRPIVKRLPASLRTKWEKVIVRYAGGSSKRDCFSPDHKASARKEKIKCSICGSVRHPDLLHLNSEENKEKAKEGVETVSSKCTTICKGKQGGLCCSKNRSG